MVDVCRAGTLQGPSWGQGRPEPKQSELAKVVYILCVLYYFALRNFRNSYDA